MRSRRTPVALATAVTTTVTTAVAVAVLGGTATAAAGHGLAVTSSCTGGRPGFLATLVQDGRAAFLRQQGEADVVVPATPGPVRLDLSGRRSEGRGWTLVDASGAALATAPALPDRGCDGWPSREAYVASEDDEPGAPQSLTRLASTPSATLRDGTRVFRAADGTFYAGRRGDSHVVRGAIDEHHRRAGGATGRLGQPLTSEFGVATLDGFFTRFTGGTVYWSAAGGAHAVTPGRIADGYASRGYERTVGLPVSEQFGPLLRGGYGQHFTGGSLYWSPASGVWHVQGAIRDRWAAAGWERSVLGYPVSDEIPVLRGSRGRVQHFQGGTVAWSDQTSAQIVRGAVRDGWDRSGGPHGWVGMPVTDEFGPLVRGGFGQHFGSGSVWWSPATGAHHVVDTGSIPQRWAQLGREEGLGYPTSDTFVNLRGQWKAQHFERGSLFSNSYLDDPGPVFLVKGAIRDRYAALGWENSSLGYPTSEERPVPGGVRQDFERGSLTWTAATGRVEQVPVG
ncbi:hypothetical protein NUM3379_27310 [Kineococcus sp. NUM-3379]